MPLTDKTSSTTIMRLTTALYLTVQVVGHSNLILKPLLHDIVQLWYYNHHHSNL